MVLTTDATPRVHLTPEQVPQDKQRVERLIAALSQGIFHDIDEKKASEILQECLKICGGLADTLSRVLQHKFFGGHTPYYWAIVNKNPKCHDPPLLKDLMFHGGTLTLETQEDIVKAFGIEFDSVLYESFKHKLGMVQTIDVCTQSSLLDQGERDLFMVSTRYGPTPTATIRFEIPRIFPRLLANNSLRFLFYGLGGLLSLTATVSKSGDRTDHPSWGFMLDEVVLPEASAVRMNRARGTIEVQVANILIISKHMKEYDNTGYCDLTFRQICIDKDLAHFLRNPFTDNARGQLNGTITVNLRD